MNVSDHTLVVGKMVSTALLIVDKTGQRTKLCSGNNKGSSDEQNLNKGRQDNKCELTRSNHVSKQ